MVIQINSFRLNFFIKSFITALLFASNIFVILSLKVLIADTFNE